MARAWHTPQRGPMRGGPFAPYSKAEDVKGVLRKLSRYFLKERVLLLCMLGVVLFGTLCGTIAPMFQSNAIDIISGDRQDAFVPTLLAMLVIYTLYSGSRLLQGYISAHLGQRMVSRLREELFGKLVHLPVSYMDRHSHGDVMSRMTNDIESLSMTVSHSLPNLVNGIFALLGTLSIMSILCWQLTLLSLFGIFLTLPASRLLGAYVRKHSRTQQSLLGELNGMIEERISGFRTVTAYNQQQNTADAFAALSGKLTQASIKNNVVGGVMGPVMNCIGNISFVIVAAFGGYFAHRGIISIGVISAFIVYVRQCSRPINELAFVYGQLQTALAGAERVFRVLEEKEEQAEGKELALESQAGLDFSHVDFSYNEGQPVLRDFCLRLPPGKMVALVGATGCGKTTVVNLLMRFYDPDAGSISINGEDIAHFSRESLRRNLAIVLQDTVLFSDSIRANLAYGNPNASEEQLRAAIELSGCKDFIDEFPDKEHTFLTGAGSSLSQGQRQLLAIARAFVANPKILILDEATSNVDTRTEKAIQEAMRSIMKERTCIVIAHRISTIRNADMIIVMENGAVVERGRHSELLRQHGKYYELYMTQYAGMET